MAKCCLSFYVLKYTPLVPLGQVFEACPGPIQTWSLAVVASKPCPSLSWASTNWPWLSPCWGHDKHWEQPFTGVQALWISQAAWEHSVFLVPWLDYRKPCAFPYTSPFTPPTHTPLCLPPWPGMSQQCQSSSSPHLTTPTSFTSPSHISWQPNP